MSTIFRNKEVLNDYLEVYRKPIFNNINNDENKDILQLLNHDKYPILKIAIEDDSELLEKYKENVIKHNNKLLETYYPDSGFDLYFPESLEIPNMEDKACLINLKIKCEMITEKYEPLPYYIYPRSSISKTPLMLANHVGIIDTGYRGNLMTAVRNLSNENNYTIEKHSRLFQICSGDLKPFFVIIVDKEDLSRTERNEGGFGSTGK